MSIEAGLNNHIWEILEDQNSVDALVDTKKKIRNHFWATSYLSVISQNIHAQSSCISVEDVCMINWFSNLQDEHSPHDLAIFQIELTSTPFRDKEIDKNNAILKNIPKPFTCVFTPANQGDGSDGFLSWNRPIHAIHKCKLNDENDHVRKEYCLLGASEVPLEVGYNSPAKFYYRLLRNGAIARWPYGQKYITVIVLNQNTPEIRSQNTPMFSATNAEFDDKLRLSGEILQEIEEQRDPYRRWGKESEEERKSVSLR